MFNQQAIDKFYKDVEALNLKKPVAAVVRATGYAKSTVSRYLNKEIPPSEKFVKKFYETLKKLQNREDAETSEDGETNIEDMILDMSVRQVALSRVLLRGISEILGNQPGKTVTGVSEDLDRAVKAEFQKLKDELANGA